MSTHLESEIASAKDNYALSTVVGDVPEDLGETNEKELPMIEEHAEWRDLLTYEEGQRLIRKIDFRLVTPLLLTYILRGMDSGAISYVKTMNTGSHTNILKQLHMTSDQYANLSTVFTLFYALGEIPSNMMFKKTTPKWHYIRIISLWSIAAICHAAAYNYAGILTARAFLGLFEAGMAPGAYLHLTYWYRPDEVGPRFAAISAMFNFCNIFVALLCYGVSFINGRGGLGGWQWVYIIQGLLALVLIVFIWAFMPGFPEDCNWLTERERKFVIGRLGPGSSRKSDKAFDIQEFKAALKNVTNLAFAVMILVYNTSALGLAFWLPSIITSFGLSNGASNVLLTIPPAFLYWVGGIGGAYLNDRLTWIPRPILLWGALAYNMAGYFMLAFIESKPAQYAIIVTMYPIASWSYQTFIPWRVQSIQGTTNAAFIMAFLTGAGQMSGLWSAQIFQSKYGPTYSIPFIVCGCCVAAAALLSGLCWYLTYDSEKETRRIQALRRKAGKEGNIVAHEEIDYATVIAGHK